MKDNLISHAVAYWDLPDQVIWVQTPVRRLQGMDFYFVGPDSYGGWNDPRNIDKYEGDQSVAFRFADGVEEQIPLDVPRGAAVYEGYMLTTPQAEFVGLI